MLDQIIIDNFATIEHLSFDVGNGFNIITGETGAGKSVLVEAISTALGGRADISMVRTGAPKARIQIAGSVDGEDVILTRELMATGKSISKINGEMVSLAQLRAYCSRFVDVHGQYDNQQILDPQNHIHITDRFKSNFIVDELAKLRSLYDNYTELSRAYKKLCADEAEATRQHDYYKFESDYITSLKLYEGEDTELREQIDFMKNSEKIYRSINTSYELLHENDESVLSALSRCSSEISSISSLTAELTEIAESLDSAYYALEDISGSLRTMLGSLNFSEDDIDSVSERLSVLEDAKRKYRMDIPGIIEYGNELLEKLNLAENFDYEKSRAKDLMDKAYEELKLQADHVSELRKVNAERLASAMRRELADLEFANSEFDIRIEKLPEIGPDGYDYLEFMISTNPGEPLRPLSRIASGGEISRIMLAFKHIIGDSDQVDTMIFDEIDTGISGKTALVVGKKMREISEHHQIICITHLPQIAAYGDDNYLIKKSIEDARTHTDIERLDEDGKIHMLANMISGSPDSESAMTAARELIEAATRT